MCPFCALGGDRSEALVTMAHPKVRRAKGEGVSALLLLNRFCVLSASLPSASVLSMHGSWPSCPGKRGKVIGSIEGGPRIDVHWRGK